MEVLFLQLNLVSGISLVCFESVLIQDISYFLGCLYWIWLPVLFPQLISFHLALFVTRRCYRISAREI